MIVAKRVRFSTAEVVQLFATAILAGFYVSFNNWGSEGTPDVALGVQNFVGAALIIALILSTIIIAQKALGAVFGYKIMYSYSWFGLLIGFFVTTASLGAIPLFVPGGITYESIKTARLGKYRLRRSSSELFTIASLVVIIPLFFALLFGALYTSAELEFFKNITVAALLIAIFALIIPIPQVRDPRTWFSQSAGDAMRKTFFFRMLEGGTYGYDMASFSPPAYILLLATTLVFTGLVLLFNYYSLVVSVLLALVIIIVYKVAIRHLK